MPDTFTSLAQAPTCWGKKSSSVLLTVWMFLLLFQTCSEIRYVFLPCANFFYFFPKKFADVVLEPCFLCCLKGLGLCQSEMLCSDYLIQSWVLLCVWNKSAQLDHHQTLTNVSASKTLMENGAQAVLTPLWSQELAKRVLGVQGQSHTRLTPLHDYISSTQAPAQFNLNAANEITRNTG